MTKICRHVTLLISKDELDNASTGPKVTHAVAWRVNDINVFYYFQ
jgi:hypothetical protein